MLTVLAIVLAFLSAIGGCSSQTSEQQTDMAVATTSHNPGEPRTVTDLSEISSAKTVPAPISALNSTASASTQAEHNPNTIVQQNIERMFVSNVDQLRYREGRSNAPGEVSLLNDKARKFSEFSYQLLNQTLTAAHSIEPDRLAGRKLPIDIAPMVLTAVMDSEGRLKDIAIDSHTGDHQVDQIIIDSCKQGLWSRNPPVGAMNPDGNYRLRIEGYIRAYSFDFKGRYKYETRLGLAIL
ncbi:MAG TPA: hypothetical protein VJ728_09190 [Candidatus Binataceae bacterium]|nr:hypothetical protein [Candidatus Binataceae bacterium]